MPGRVIGDVMDAVRAGRPVPPAGALLLLRRYLRTGDAALRDGVSQALAQGIDQGAADPLWIEPLAEAAAIADDPRVDAAVAAMASALRGSAPILHAAELAGAARVLDAALRAAPAVGDARLLEHAVDRLEQIVGAWYEPGCGMADGDRFDDQVWTASALVSAYLGTGRLPYAMLAEELGQFAARTPVAPTAQPAAPPLVPAAGFARVLVALHQLHLDPEYRDQSVVAPGADYGAQAERLLNRYARPAHEAGLDASLYAVAVDEYLAARDLQ